MAKKKLNKELKLKNVNNFRITLGTINRENPKVVYVTGRAWAIPPELEDAEYAVDTIKKTLRNSVRNEVSMDLNIDKRYIIDFGLKADSIIPNRRKFISFELLFRQNEVKDIRELTDSFQNKMERITGNLSNKMKEFDFKFEEVRS